MGHYTTPRIDMKFMFFEPLFVCFIFLFMILYADCSKILSHIQYSELIFKPSV
jgi:hypothetical protein